MKALREFIEWLTPDRTITLLVLCLAASCVGDSRHVTIQINPPTQGAPK